MTKCDAGDFFHEFWSDIEPSRYMSVEGHLVRIIEETPTIEYSSVHSVDIPKEINYVVCLKSELPKGWRPIAGKSVIIDEDIYQIYQAVPVQPASPDGAVVRFTVHKQ